MNPPQTTDHEPRINSFLPTRASLLSRLKDSQDHHSWREFCTLYRKLIACMAARAGLSEAEAADVAQETFIIISRKIPEFRYDPTRGSFKSWIGLIARRRIEKQLKKRLPSRSSFSSDDSTRTSTIHRLPAPESFEITWNAEWEHNLRTAALDRVKSRLKPKQFQMFDLYALKQWPIAEVARALNVSATHVYVNKHRVAAALRRELAQLKNNDLHSIL
jgi:RNA polymerase sigma factor (sigma-70 family)